MSEPLYDLNQPWFASQPVPEILRLNALELAEHYQSGQLSPIEVVAQTYEWIDHVNPQINSWVTYDHVLERTKERATKLALASAQRWKTHTQLSNIDGIPVGIKETQYSEGDRNTNGCKAFRDLPASTIDAPVVTQVKNSGGIIIGKTTTPDFCMSTSGVSSMHGITRNPINPAWTVGGSSSGAAAALAGYMAPLHVGSDIGGSIRFPSACCAVGGLKPTYGRVPLESPYIARVVGPMARTAAELAVLLDIISRPDSRDFTSMDYRFTDYLTPASSSFPQGIKIGLITELDYVDTELPLDPRVIRATEYVAEKFAASGAIIEKVPPFIRRDDLAAVGRFLQLRVYSSLLAASRAQGRDMSQEIDPFIREWLADSDSITGSQAVADYEHFYTSGQHTIEVTADYDLLLAPVSSIVSFPFDHTAPKNDPSIALNHVAFTFPFNVSGQPSGVVIAGKTDIGQPIGVQIIAQRFEEKSVLQALRWWEENHPSPGVF